jgi:hypothetical protein
MTGNFDTSKADCRDFPNLPLSLENYRGVFETCRSRGAIESNPPGLKKSVTSGGVVLIRASHFFD